MPRLRRDLPDGSHVKGIAGQNIILEKHEMLRALPKKAFTLTKKDASCSSAFIFAAKSFIEEV